MEEKAESGHRRTNKPLMEKRRRARINMCLGELKNLVLMAMNKDNSQFSKLEKADILEMAVKYLRHVQSSSMASAAIESTVMAKYQLGYGECAREVMLCLGQNQHVGEDLRNRVSDHLTKCLYSVHTAQSQALAMRNFQSLGLIPAQTTDGCTAPPNGLPRPGFQDLYMPPETNFTSTVVPTAVKVEPGGHLEPTTRLTGFIKNEMSTAMKTEPLFYSSEERKFKTGSSPVSLVKSSSSHTPYNSSPPTLSSSSATFGSSSATFNSSSATFKSNPATFAVGKSSVSVSPSCSQSTDNCLRRKRRLSQDGNVSSSTPQSPDNMESRKQRRLSTDFSAIPNKPVDESVWRPW